MCICVCVLLCYMFIFFSIHFEKGLLFQLCDFVFNSVFCIKGLFVCFLQILCQVFCVTFLQSFKEKLYLFDNCDG